MTLGSTKVGRAERGFLHQDGAENEADRHARETEEQHGVGDALQGVERGQPVERDPPGIVAGLRLGFEAAFLDQVEERGQQAESQGGVGSQKCRDVGDQPACSDAFRWEAVALNAERGDEDQEESDGEGKDAEGDGVVKPPGQKEQAGDGKSKQRFGFAGSDGHPAMGLDEHFDDRNEVEEEGHAAQMYAPPCAHARRSRARRGKLRSLPRSKERSRLGAREDACRTQI